MRVTVPMCPPGVYRVRDHLRGSCPRPARVMRGNLGPAGPASPDFPPQIFPLRVGVGVAPGHSEASRESRGVGGIVRRRPDVVRRGGLFTPAVSLRPLASVPGLAEHALAQPAPAWAGVVKAKAGALSAVAVPGLRHHVLRSLRISVVYSLRQRGHQIGRFSASVSAVIRWSFLRQVGQVIHPSCAVISISDFMVLHKPFLKIIYFPRQKKYIKRLPAPLCFGPHPAQHDRRCREVFDVLERRILGPRGVLLDDGRTVRDLDPGVV